MRKMMKKVVYEELPSIDLDDSCGGSLLAFIKKLEFIQDTILLKYPDAKITCTFDYDDYSSSMGFSVTRLETDEEYTQRLKDEVNFKKRKAEQAKEKRKQKALEDRALYEKLKAKFEK